MTQAEAHAFSSFTSSDATALRSPEALSREATAGHGAALRERFRLDGVPDDALHEGVKKLVGRHNALTAEILAHLAEVDARGIYRERACSSLYTYCVYELRFSEDEAQRRSQAARTARKFPALFEMLADGAIHMTGLLLLSPHLTVENSAELLARARFRTKREIERLVAEVAPRADVPARIEPLGPASRVTNLWQAYTASLRGRVRDLEPGTGRGQAPAPVFEVSEQSAVSDAGDLGPHRASESSAPARSETPSANDSEPVVPLRYRIEFTVDEGYVALLEEARNLLQHQIPNRDIARIHELAMALLVEQLRKRRTAASSRRRAKAERGAFSRACVKAADSFAAEGRNEESVVEESARERIDDVSQAAGCGAESSSLERPAPERNRASPRLEESAPERIESDSAADGHELLPSKRSAPERMATTSRHVPAEVRRVVWTRDGGRCTFRDASGRRCRERSGLELHHEHAFALGGETTIENLRLVCRAHNALLAERDFGRAHVERVRNGRRLK